jgi:regulatory protein
VPAKGDRPGDVPEVAPVPQRLPSRNGGAAADTAAPGRAIDAADTAPHGPSGPAGERAGESSNASGMPDVRDGEPDLPEHERRTSLADSPEAASNADRLRNAAFETAWRYLAHRERTEAEMVARLERNDVEPALIEEILDELREGGYVDDAGFAKRFAEDRRNLDQWGNDRIERRLRELGIDRAHIAEALAGDDEHDELAAATALLRRRFPVPPETPKDLERALGFLVRKGYDLELAHDALRRHGALTLDS